MQVPGPSKYLLPPNMKRVLPPPPPSLVISDQGPKNCLILGGDGGRVDKLNELDSSAFQHPFKRHGKSTSNDSNQLVKWIQK